MTEEDNLSLQLRNKNVLSEIEILENKVEILKNQVKNLFQF